VAARDVPYIGPMKISETNAGWLMVALFGGAGGEAP
jgi:hypothetical protein